MFLPNSMNLHASECNHFALFCLNLFIRFEPRIVDAPLWRRGLETLSHMLHVCDTCEWSVETDMAQSFCEAVIWFNRTCERLGMKGTPKHHYLTELAARMLYQGSPKLLGTWADESANKILKSVGTRSGVQRRLWALRSLDDFRNLRVVGGSCSSNALS